MMMMMWCLSCCSQHTLKPHQTARLHQQYRSCQPSVSWPSCWWPSAVRLSAFSRPTPSSIYSTPTKPRCGRDSTSIWHYAPRSICRWESPTCWRRPTTQWTLLSTVSAGRRSDTVCEEYVKDLGDSSATAADMRPRPETGLIYPTNLCERIRENFMSLFSIRGEPSFYLRKTPSDRFRTDLLICDFY